MVQFGRVRRPHGCGVEERLSGGPRGRGCSGHLPSSHPLPWLLHPVPPLDGSGHAVQEVAWLGPCGWT